jgi:hypothetical protein
MRYERGVIRNREFALQERDFRGLEYGYCGRITPTDIDGYIEYHRRGHVFIEAKYKSSALRGGQRRALEQLCDDLQQVRPCIVIVANHQDPVNGKIAYAGLSVTEYRFEGKWYPGGSLTTKELVDKFINYLNRV